MLSDYLNAAMRQAAYETMEDGTVWGEIPGFPGLWATGVTPEECERELRSTLEDWILIATRFGDTLPVGEKLRRPIERQRDAAPSRQRSRG